MTRSNLIDLQVIYQTRTERAVCIRETEDGPDVWLPMSADQGLWLRTTELRIWKADE